MQPPPRIATTYPPASALWLGGFGAVPFVALAVAAWILAEPAARAASDAIVAYGAVVLSFIGGSYWGFASIRMTEGRTPKADRLLVLSVVPSLVGWASLLLATPWSVALLAVAFLGVLFVDRWVLAIAFAPPWWVRLRLPLSATVAACLLAALLALVAGPLDPRPA